MRFGADGTPRVKSLISKNDISLEKGEPPDADLSDISRHARLVLEIVPGERRLLPEFGCRIHELDLQTQRAREVAAAFVEEALERWTPRLGVDRAEIGELQAGRVEVSLHEAGLWHRLWITHRRLRREDEA